MNTTPRLFQLLSIALTVAAAGCSPAMIVDMGNASFQVRESVEQLQITHATPGAALAVFDSHGVSVQTGTADKLGSLVFRKLPAGTGYVVRATQTVPEQHSRALTVMAVDGSLPAHDFYSSQKLQPGFGYIKTRDGTTLSIFVTLPGPAEAGPYPTIVDYSGYAPSAPQPPIQMYAALCDSYPTICAPPNDPSAEIASFLDFATVSVNMRGTGCSGGAYDYFETLQLLDGYDVIETVAAQDWVQFHQVGMTGLSYPGITQLFVATMHAPGLAAILPLSVIGNTASTLLPGGILNNGFALNWATNVLDRADPYGQGWEKARVDGGDMLCGENQLLHGQKIDNVMQARTTPYYDPAVYDRLNPTHFADQINVPVFLAGAYQDEQTGPYFTTLLDRMTSAPVTRFTVYNGVHPDGFAPQILIEWKTFLDLFVARRVPFIPTKIRGFAPLIFQNVYGTALQLPPDRFTKYTNYQDALAAYKAEPPVRAIFESGAGDKDLGAPVGTFERSFAKWPVPEAVVQRYYLHADGSLGAAMPVEADASSSFVLDADAGKRGNLPDSENPDAKLPRYDWQQPSAGHAASFVTDALPGDMLFLGTGSADLWIKSTANDADLQVCVSEVRPDGNETYVQCGWLRSSLRALEAGSTPLWPSPTYTEKDASLLVPGQWTQVRVPIPAFGHPFRAGSRIRVIVDTPGGTRPAWRFELKAFPGPVTHSIGHSAAHPSSVALSLVAGGAVPSPLPPCPSLRGQPCRAAAPYANTPGN